MSDKTSIEWTDSTWNPIRARNLETGQIGWHCEHVSPGCKFCYAGQRNKGFFQLGTRLDYAPASRDKVEIFLDEETLVKPLRWKRPRKIFVCSMTDLFGEFHTDEQIDRVFAVMALSPQHTFQVLTKRADRMLEYLKYKEPGSYRIFDLVRKMFPEKHPSPNGFIRFPLPNVWLGVSVEDQKRADERIPLLLQTPAAIRFLSCEPLLGAIDLKLKTYPEFRSREERQQHIVPRRRDLLHWLIAGGESGPGARPMHPDWPRSLRDQCVDAGVPFFFKQWGEWCPLAQIPKEIDINLSFPANDERHCKQLGSAVDSKCLSIKTGKTLGGRLLDGKEWNQFPEALW